MLEERKERVITISAEASQAVQGIINEKNMGEHALRIYVSARSCSGVQFGIALDKEINDTDMTVEMKGVKMVVDHQSLDYVRGANVDFVNDPQKGAGFVISNPNQEGCGYGNAANSCGGGCDH